MSGSLSLIIVLIVVVWAIVLAPMVLGDSKPIRRSGDGYDETRVLHQGGTVPVQGRRRPRVTAADVHHFEDEHDYELVDADEFDDLDDHELADDELIDGEVIDDADENDADEFEPAGSTKVDLGSIAADAVDGEGEDAYTEYELDDSYFSPEDYGYTSSTVVSMPADGETEELEKLEDLEHPEELNDLEDELPEEDKAEAEIAEAEIAEAELTDTELADEEIDEVAIARARRGRGGWDPQAAQRAREERFRRRQRAFLGLVSVTGIAFVFALFAGGWAWLAPVAAAGLLAWYLVALRSTVKQERALHARRVRQLHRARLGVVSAEEGAPLPAHMRRPGAIIVEMDDESADFANLPMHRGPQLHGDDELDNDVHRYERDLHRDHHGRVREIA